jgi:interferon gamma-inducible protein 30
MHASITPNPGSLGGYLTRRAIERTRSLVPAQKWVPWVLVNGVPLFEDGKNLSTFICAAYNGYPK